MTANPGLAGTRPNDVRIRRRNGELADGGNGLAVKDRFPVHAPVYRFPNSTRSRADVIDVGVAGAANDGSQTVSGWADVEITQTAHNVPLTLLCFRWGDPA